MNAEQQRVAHGAILPQAIIAQVEMSIDKHCKGSVRFGNDSDVAPISTAYINRVVPEIGTATTIRITVERIS